MKRFVVAILIVLLLSSSAFAEYEGWTVEALQEKKASLMEEINDKNEELARINTVLGEAKKQEELSSEREKISDIFPDENLAIFVRDQLAKFSIYQTVTQDELDSIRKLNGNYKDLTGIGRLRFISQLSLTGDSITHFPDEMRNCTRITNIFMPFNGLIELPEWIGELELLSELDLSFSQYLVRIPDGLCELMNLKKLNISQSNSIIQLPENIGNCINLNTIDVTSTSIQSLPRSIGNLVNLKTLKISYTNIKELPISIWNLELKTLEMKGLPIK